MLFVSFYKIKFNKIFMHFIVSNTFAYSFSGELFDMQCSKESSRDNFEQKMN